MASHRCEVCAPRNASTSAFSGRRWPRLIVSSGGLCSIGISLPWTLAPGSIAHVRERPGGIGDHLRVFGASGAASTVLAACGVMPSFSLAAKCICSKLLDSYSHGVEVGYGKG